MGEGSRQQTVTTAATSEPGAAVSLVLPAHFPALDGVRGIAILAVLAFHMNPFQSVTARGALRLLQLGADAGWLGVELFFVLSGFLITRILLDTRSSPRYFRNFYIRRLLRIFPVYYVFLAVRFLVAPAVVPALAVPFGTQIWYWTYLANWQMGHGTPPSGTSPLWSLAIEEQFYLLWPVIVWRLGPRALARTCIAFVVGALVVRAIAVHLGLVNLAYNSTVSRLDALALGALTALVVRDRRWLAEVRARLPRWTAVTAAALLVVMLPLRGLPRLNPWTLTLGCSLTQLLFAALVLVCVLPSERPRLRWLSLRPLRVVGRYSYGMYLFHLPLHLVAFPHVEGWLMRQSPGRMLLAGLLYSSAMGLVVLGVAALSYDLIEKRFLAMKEILAPCAGRAAARVEKSAGAEA